jgi:hypothetical protein
MQECRIIKTHPLFHPLATKSNPHTPRVTSGPESESPINEQALRIDWLWTLSWRLVKRIQHTSTPEARGQKLTLWLALQGLLITFLQWIQTTFTQLVGMKFGANSSYRGHPTLYSFVSYHQGRGNDIDRSDSSANSCRILNFCVTVGLRKICDIYQGNTSRQCALAFSLMTTTNEPQELECEIFEGGRSYRNILPPSSGLKGTSNLRSYTHIQIPYAIYVLRKQKWRRCESFR